MFNDPLHRVHRWIELIVLAVVISAAIQRIKHPLGKTLLAIGRTSQQIYDTSGSRTQELLVIFQ